MQFLIMAEAVDVGPLLPAQQVLQLQEQVIKPSFQMLAEWEQQGKAKVGGFAGQRAGCLLLEAESAEEVHRLLSTLPLWGIAKWQVQPLVPVQVTLDVLEQQIGQLRTMLEHAGEVPVG
jgi:muconolactone delta-isomerase